MLHISASEQVVWGQCIYLQKPSSDCCYMLVGFLNVGKCKGCPISCQSDIKWSRVIALCIHDLSTGMGWRSAPHPGHIIFRNQTQLSLYRGVVGPQNFSWWLQIILPPAAFEPQTIQPVVSHYADRSITDPVNMNVISKYKIGYCNKIYALDLPVPLWRIPWPWFKWTTALKLIQMCYVIWGKMERIKLKMSSVFWQKSHQKLINILQWTSYSEWLLLYSAWYVSYAWLLLYLFYLFFIQQQCINLSLFYVKWCIG